MFFDRDENCSGNVLKGENGEFKFLDHGMDYWIELEKNARCEDKVDLYEEIAVLRAKVSFYEDRIGQMYRFLYTTNDMSNNK